MASPKAILDITQEHTQFFVHQDVTIIVPAPTSVTSKRDRLIVIITNPNSQTIRNITWDFDFFLPVQWEAGNEPSTIGGTSDSTIETFVIELWENDLQTGWLGKYNTYHNGVSTSTLTIPLDIVLSTVDTSPGLDELQSSVIIPHDTFMPVLNPDASAFADIAASDGIVISYIYHLSTPTFVSELVGTVTFQVGSTTGTVDWYEDRFLNAGDVIQLVTHDTLAVDSTLEGMVVSLVGCYQPAKCTFGPEAFNWPPVLQMPVFANMTLSTDGPTEPHFSYDGLTLYITGRTGGGLGVVNQYTMTTAHHINTATLDTTLDVTTEDSSPEGIWLNASGTRMYLVGDSSDRILQYDLNIPGDVSTASFIGSVSTSIIGYQNPHGLAFNPDGSRVFVVGNTTGPSGPSVSQLDLSTSFDITTASFAGQFSFNTIDDSPRGIHFNPDGNIMYMVGTQTDSIHQFTLATAYNVTTLINDNISYQFTEDTNPQGITMNTTATKLLMVGTQNNNAYLYTI